MSDHPPLSIADVVALDRIVRACSHKRVRWLTERGDLLDGVARSIGDQNGNFLQRGEDVRDGYLRISGTFEHFLPVKRVMEMLGAGEFAVDD